MFAIIETGGKQYKVSEGDRIKIEKINAEENGLIKFDQIYLIEREDEVVVGRPYVSGVSVEGKILRDGRDDKKIIFRYHSKTRYRKKKGHRQPFTEVEITKIS